MTDDNDKKKYEVEWSFSFEQFGESISQLMTQLGLGIDADMRQTTLSTDREGCSRATIRLDFTVGRVQLSALPEENDKLIEADLTSIGEVEMVTRFQGGSKSVWLRQKRSADEPILKPVKDAVDTVAHNRELMWDVRLARKIPLHLEISSGITLDHIDLTGLNVARMVLDGGAGGTDVTFPAARTHAEIDGGVGRLHIIVPDRAKASMNIDGGAGPVHIGVGEADLKAEIKGGVGNCVIEVPEGAAFRVTAESGLGNIDVPEKCQPMNIESDFISESGRWQTPGYEFAIHKIDIRYTGGVGSLIVREMPPTDKTDNDFRTTSAPDKV